MIIYNLSIKVYDFYWNTKVFYASFSSVETNIVKTEIAEPSLNPIWNTTLEMPNVRSETLVEKQMEVILYDYRPDKEDVILGN